MYTTKDYLKKLLSVGKSKKKSSPIKSKLIISLIWVVGLIVSFIPIIASTAIDSLFNAKGLEFTTILLLSFANYEALFIAISMAVTSLTDLVVDYVDGLHKIHIVFFLVNIILILICMTMYIIFLCAIAAKKLPEDFSSLIIAVLSGVVIGINFIYKLTSRK